MQALSQSRPHCWPCTTFHIAGCHFKNNASKQAQHSHGRHSLSTIFWRAVSMIMLLHPVLSNRWCEYWQMDAMIQVDSMINWCRLLTTTTSAISALSLLPLRVYRTSVSQTLTLGPGSPVLGLLEENGTDDWWWGNLLARPCCSNISVIYAKLLGPSSEWFIDCALS